MSQPDDDAKTQSGFWERALEHKLFSGIAGSILVAAVAIVAIVAGNGGGSAPTSSGSTAVAESPATESTTQAGEDQDGDLVSDALDECPREPGVEPSGCPDGDGDGVIDNLDRCPEMPARTEDGCPAEPRSVGLINWAEHEGHEVLLTENVEVEQGTVGGITDPEGLVMELGESHRSAGITIFANGTLRLLKGQVGISSEPCSPGSVAYVSIRDAEGEQIWPGNGRPKAVHRDSVPFEVSIAGEDSAVLYAEAPEAEEGYCGSFLNMTEIGWVHISVTK